MKKLSFRVVEQLSAYLDGQLSQAERARLEARLRADPELAAALDDLRRTRSLLHRSPQRRAPRNFTLTPKMAGLKPPLPPLVPALSWASAVAVLLFFLTLGSSLLGGLSFGAASPRLSAAPAAQADNSQPRYGLGGGAPAATQAPAMAAPATEAPATEAPVLETALATATPEISGLQAPEAATQPVNPPPESPPAPKAQPRPIHAWPFVWLGLGVLLIAAALLIRRANQRAFLRKNSPNH